MTTKKTHNQKPASGGFTILAVDSVTKENTFVVSGEERKKMLFLSITRPEGTWKRGQLVTITRLTSATSISNAISVKIRGQQVTDGHDNWYWVTEVVTPV